MKKPECRHTQIVFIDRAIAHAPDRPHYWETRGIYHVDLREFPAAIADFDGAMEHLVQLAPQVATSYYVRGKARAALGHYDEAIADFKDA